MGCFSTEPKHKFGITAEVCEEGEEKKRNSLKRRRLCHAAGKHDVKHDTVGQICPIESTFVIITRCTIYRRLLQMCYISEHYHI